MAKAGRPSKGPRQRLSGWVPQPLADVFTEAKHESPYKTDSDFVAAILADYFGKPEYKPTPQVTQQEVLDIPA